MFLLRHAVCRIQLLESPSFAQHDPNCSFPDRDMLLRFHWGLGVGHTYSHASMSPQTQKALAEDDLETTAAPDAQASTVRGEDDPDSDDPELGTGNREDDSWDVATQHDTDSGESFNSCDEEIGIMGGVMMDTLDTGELDFYE